MFGSVDVLDVNREREGRHPSLFWSIMKRKQTRHVEEPKEIIKTHRSTFDESYLQAMWRNSW